MINDQFLILILLNIYEGEGKWKREKRNGKEETGRGKKKKLHCS